MAGFVQLFALVGLCGIMVQAKGLTMENLYVPQFALVGSDVELSCYFTVGKGSTVYMLKWFKDGAEFFRFLPSESPQIRVFPIRGVNVQESNCSINRVRLSNVTESTSGSYRCEVSEDAPSFSTALKQAEMRVIRAPTSRPQLTGFVSTAAVGDQLQGTCSFQGFGSSPAMAAIRLSLYINNDTVNDAYIVKYPMGFNGTEQVAAIGLANLTIEHRHFQRSNATHLQDVEGLKFISLKCVASLDSLGKSWAWAKVIQEASTPYLLRDPHSTHPRRSSHRPVVPRLRNEYMSDPADDEAPQSLVTATTTTASPTRDNSSSSNPSLLLISRIAELISSQNEELRKLTRVQNERLMNEKGLVALRREELEFLKNLKNQRTE